MIQKKFSVLLFLTMINIIKSGIPSTTEINILHESAIIQERKATSPIWRNDEEMIMFAQNPNLKFLSLFKAGEQYKDVAIASLHYCQEYLKQEHPTFSDRFKQISRSKPNWSDIKKIDEQRSATGINSADFVIWDQFRTEVTKEAHTQNQEYISKLVTKTTPCAALSSAIKCFIKIYKEYEEVDNLGIKAAREFYKAFRLYENLILKFNGQPLITGTLPSRQPIPEEYLLFKRFAEEELNENQSILAKRRMIVDAQIQQVNENLPIDESFTKSCDREIEAAINATLEKFGEPKARFRSTTPTGRAPLRNLSNTPPRRKTPNTTPELRPTVRKIPITFSLEGNND